jgi:hypothetical protein
MKKTNFFFLLFIILLTSCSSSYSSKMNKHEGNNRSSQSSTKNYGNTSKEKQLSYNKNMKDDVNSENNISEKIKKYIFNGQKNKPEAQKIKWNKTFLNCVDIELLYNQYIAHGGHADDLESFASYMTQNAPILNDWKDLFKKDLYDTYGEKVVRLEHLKDDLYQAYIIKNHSEIPYVVVSSRTGYYHG